VSARTLVVDASIARSCGDDNAIDSVAILCRDTLLAIRDSGLWVAMSPALMAEWVEHRSRFAVKWLGEMVDRRMIRAINPPEHQELRAAMALVEDMGVRNLLQKDLLLAEAALDVDLRLLSRDRKARQHFAALAATIPVLRGVHWVNPEDTNCLLWLGAGAPDDSSLLLSPS
jgi:hypothetical protein